MAIFTAMEENHYNVLGVMSGTSLDGIDLAQVKFSKEDTWSYKIAAAETIPYPKQWVQKLNSAVHLKAEDLGQLNEEYTDLLGDVISGFLKRHNLSALDAVCSHGHTVKHEPENAYTLQIGNLPKLAIQLQQKVICDFRVQDVKLGGQGAPLVPIGDQLLFGEYNYCINLGGFANISTATKEGRIAYDICAVNTVLNFLAGKMDLAYDKDGAVARSGRPDPELLKKLNSLPFYGQNPPKSLGIEWVNREILPLLTADIAIPDALRTYAEHAAEQIASEITSGPDVKVLLTGGGAFNSFLVEQIRRRTEAQIVIPSKEVVNFKEALIFAFLGVLKMRGEVNVLSSVTGASKDHSAGNIFLPSKS